MRALIACYATTVWLVAALRFDAAENGSSARARTMTAAANLIRATVNNRVDNEVSGASVAIHCRRR